MSVRLLLALVCACVVSGCDRSGGTTQTAAVVPPPASTQADAVRAIINRHCVACHNGQQKLGELDLEPDDALASLVARKSSESAQQLVVAGDPEHSYLYAKLTGTHLEAGGSGLQMPLGSVPLMSDKLETVRAWIAAGAKP